MVKMSQAEPISTVSTLRQTAPHTNKSFPDIFLSYYKHTPLGTRHTVSCPIQLLRTTLSLKLRYCSSNPNVLNHGRVRYKCVS